MILTISTTHAPATDLGYLLHKHPDKAQSFDLPVGTAHVFFPEATSERATAALLLDVDPLDLARASGRKHMSDFTLGQYVNDRPYAASSLLAVALKKVFSTAAAGVLKSNQALADSVIPLEIAMPALPCAGGPAMAEDLFAPLGWVVEATTIALDPAFEDWGTSRFVDFRATATMRLADALNHLYILLPVLDDAKHYWVGLDEVDKLVSHSEGWLANHPMRELITRRYLAHSRRLIDDALERLVELGDEDAVAIEQSAERDDIPEVSATPAETLEGGRDSSQRTPLKNLRRDAIVDLLQSVDARDVADVGCGSGALLRPLLANRQFRRVIGTDVSAMALDRAAVRLGVERMSEREAERLELFQSSATYRDQRLAGLDAIVLMEVIEHLDWDRLPALASSIFGSARPRHIIVSTPNSDYNTVFESLPAGAMRHPDHRWEMSREEFSSWAAGVCTDYAYTVTLSGVGDAVEGLGQPTQMALFSRIDRGAGS